MVVPTMIMTKPIPYPKIIPASHMEGPEGIKNTGKRAREATSTRARTGRPKAVASHCMKGKRTYSEIEKDSVKIKQKDKRTSRKKLLHKWWHLLFLTMLFRIEHDIWHTFLNSRRIILK